MAGITDDSAAAGLDETRRLLYMALLVNRTKRYNLAGTLVNALAHHFPANAVLDVDEIADHVVGLLEQAPSKPADEAWVRDQIARITIELDG